ncbi:MAG: Spo0B domain-containing protein [Firmicutes bacterium]|nr:Spo0B domain-containing protein [Bacillota bacterium]
MRSLIGRGAALLALGAVAYWLHRPWRYLALIALAVYLVEWVKLKHRQETIYIVRQRRHRMANQLQVVMGWLELGAAEKARDILDGVLTQSIRETPWFHGLPTRWTYLLLQWDARAEARGLRIRWDGLETLVPSYRMAWMLHWRLAQAIDLADSPILVQIRGQRFRIALRSKSPKAPKGWLLGAQGLEFSWQSGRRPRMRGRSFFSS